MGLRDGVGAHTGDVGRVCARGRTQDELEGEGGVEGQAGELGGRVGGRTEDGGDTLRVFVDVERADLGGGERERGPLEDDGGLGDVANLGKGERETREREDEEDLELWWLG